MVPEYWLTEGGQSATGALLDYMVENHVAAPLLANRAASQSKFLGLYLKRDDASWYGFLFVYAQVHCGIIFGKYMKKHFEMFEANIAYTQAHRLSLFQLMSITNFRILRLIFFSTYFIGISLYELLNKILVSMMHESNISFLSALTKDIHVLPDFHGNRYGKILRNLLHS